MKTENYEVIFAIVNAGFAEDVMDVALGKRPAGRHHTNARVADFDLVLVLFCQRAWISPLRWR